MDASLVLLFRTFLLFFSDSLFVNGTFIICLVKRWRDEVSRDPGARREIQNNNNMRPLDSDVSKRVSGRPFCFLNESRHLSISK